MASPGRTHAGAGVAIERLRLQTAATGEQPFVASLASVSALGAEVAARLAREEGIDGRVAVDDCCCARAAALRTAPATSSNTNPSDMTTSLVRLRR